MSVPPLPARASSACSLVCAGIVAAAAPCAAQQPTLVRFVVPGADTTYARGVDAQGRVAGGYVLPGGTFRGYLRDASGSVQLLDWPGGSYTAFEGASEGGTAVGFAVGPGSAGPIEYDAGAWTALAPPPMSTVFLQGANDAGLRAGHWIAADATRHGVLFTNGVPTLLDFPGAQATELEDVNANGVVVGNYCDANSIWHGFAHDLNSAVFRTIDHPHAAETKLAGLNDQGDLVGQVLPQGGGPRRAVLFANQQWSDLDLFGALGATFTGDVSNAGLVCGDYYGRYDGADVVLGFVFDPNGDGPTRTCDATVNSSGNAADIHFAGSTSLAANDLVLEAGPAPANTSGVFFYGTTAAQVPFGDGFLCVGAPQYRLGPAVTDGAGFARQAFDASAPPSPAAQVTAGSTWHFQYWFRDVAAGGAGNNTSRALSVTFAP